MRDGERKVGVGEVDSQEFKVNGLTQVERNIPNG